MLAHWFKLHIRNCVDALRDLGARPLATTLTAAVIAIALALPASLNLLVKNGRNLAGGWESARNFSVYLVPGTAPDAARKLATDLGRQDGVAEVVFTDADTALASFRESSGLGDAIDQLDKNPLPHTLTVTPEDTATGEQLRKLAAQLEARNDVDLVQIDTVWVERLNAILDFLRRVVLIATVLLVAGLLIIIGNTIRLDIQNRRDEIEVLKLLGASDGFVRQPFLYVGLWYGVCGGVLALLLLLISGWVLSGPVERLIGLYGAEITVLGLDGATALLVLAGGVLAGWGGAWTAVARHLSAIQPR